MSIFLLWRKFDENNKAKNPWRVLQFGELLSYALDPILISYQLGLASTALFNIYQKYLIAYYLIPIAISPISSLLKFEADSNRVQKVLYRWVFGGTFLLTSFFLVFYKSIFSLLSQNQIAPSFLILCVVLITGISSSLISIKIQSSVIGEDLKTRVRFTFSMSILSLLFTWFFLPSIGISIVFLTSFVSSLVVFLALNMKFLTRLKEKMHNYF